MGIQDTVLRLCDIAVEEFDATPNQIEDLQAGTFVKEALQLTNSELVYYCECIELKFECSMQDYIDEIDNLSTLSIQQIAAIVSA